MIPGYGYRFCKYMISFNVKGSLSNEVLGNSPTAEAQRKISVIPETDNQEPSHIYVYWYWHDIFQ